MFNKKITYSIYLIKDDFVTQKKYLQNTSGCDHFTIAISGHSDAHVYINKVTSKTHEWSKLLPFNVSGIDWNKYQTSSLFLLLILEINNHIFAITSGLGRYLLHPFSVENKFGFKVVLNSVDPETIQQLSKRTISQNPKTSIEQITKGVTINHFGIDNFTDLIQRVKGKSKLAALGISLDGEDALKISIPHELHELPSLLENCLREFKSNSYVKYFPDIDNLSIVKDKEQLSFLNNELEIRLKAELKNVSKNKPLSGDIWASIPEIVTDPDFECFTYKQSESALQYYDIELKDIISEYYLTKTKTIRRDITLNSLRADRIFIRKSNGITYQKWKASSCINAFIDMGNDSFCFTENEWFRVSKNYIDKLDKKIASIDQSNLLFSDWPHQQSEKDYLESHPLLNHKEYLILDRDNINIDGQSAIEPCDIYTKDKQLIHVKRYGSSSLLGHLFNQGYVSGDLLINSLEFKDKFNNKLRDDYLISEINPSEFTIAYVIGTKHINNFELPLFSKITLTKTYDELRKKGFNVTLDLCNMTLLP